jgi:hypothetical protein
MTVFTMQADGFVPTSGPLGYFPFATGEAAGAITNYVYPVLHVMRYGAVADWNGTTGTDNATAFNAATAAAVAIGGTVIVPAGQYYKNAQWLINLAAGTAGVGVEMDLNAVIFDGPAVTGSSIKVTGTNTAYRCNLLVNGNHRNNTTAAAFLELVGTRHVNVKGINMQMHNTKAGYGVLKLSSSTPGDVNSCCFWTRIDNLICLQRNGGDGTFADYAILMTGGQNATWIGKGCSFGQVNTAIGFRVDTIGGDTTLPNGCLVDGPAFEGCVDGIAIPANGFASTGNRVVNCRVESVTGNFINLLPVGGAIVGAGNLVISGGAGVGVFGTSQAGGNIAAGKMVKLSGVDYFCQAFNGTTGVTLRTLDRTGYPVNGTYASFSAYPTQATPSDPLAVDRNYATNGSVGAYLYNPAGIEVVGGDGQGFNAATMPVRIRANSDIKQVVRGAGHNVKICDDSGGTSFAAGHLVFGDWDQATVEAHVWVNTGNQSLYYKFGSPPTSGTDGTVIVSYASLLPVYGLQILTSAGKIIGGGVSVAIRNNLDTANSLLVTDAGDVTALAKFGCNGKAAQASSTVAVAAVDPATTMALVNQLRALLIANGIAV